MQACIHIIDTASIKLHVIRCLDEPSACTIIQVLALFHKPQDMT